jgi:hypothetical protein
MQHQIPVQSWLPPTIAEEVKAYCQRHALPVSELIRNLIMEACEAGLGENRIEKQLGSIASDLNFTAVALDALLAGHPDPELRGRVHDAFSRKEERRRGHSASTTGGGQ